MAWICQRIDPPERKTPACAGVLISTWLPISRRAGRCGAGRQDRDCHRGHGCPRTAGTTVTARATVATTTRTTTARTGALCRLRAAIRVETRGCMVGREARGVARMTVRVLVALALRAIAGTGRTTLTACAATAFTPETATALAATGAGPFGCRTDGLGRLRRTTGTGPRAPGPALRWPLGPVLTPSGTYQVRNVRIAFRQRTVILRRALLERLLRLLGRCFTADRQAALEAATLAAATTARSSRTLSKRRSSRPSSAVLWPLT